MTGDQLEAINELRGAIRELDADLETVAAALVGCDPALADLSTRMEAGGPLTDHDVRLAALAVRIARAVAGKRIAEERLRSVAHLFN